MGGGGVCESKKGWWGEGDEFPLLASPDHILLNKE